MTHDQTPLSSFEKVKLYLQQLEISIDREDADQMIFVVSDRERGITGLMLDCEADVLILEQIILKLPGDDLAFFKRLLQINRELVHGAFVLDQDSQWVLFRDTLQLANLDLNELEASINALALGLVAHAEELIAMARGSAA